MKTMLMMLALTGTAHADLVTVYQCESRCVAMDYKRNTFQILGMKQSGFHLQLQDAWLELNAACESERYTASWIGRATSLLLVKNKTFRRPLVLEMETKANACKSSHVSEYELVPEFEGYERVGG